MAWAGYYADPLHGHCLRAVRPTRDPRVYQIVGVYGDDEPSTGAPWTAVLTLFANGAVVDFAGKPTKRQRYLGCRKTHHCALLLCEHSQSPAVLPVRTFSLLAVFARAAIAPLLSHLPQLSNGCATGVSKTDL